MRWGGRAKRGDRKNSMIKTEARFSGEQEEIRTQTTTDWGQEKKEVAGTTLSPKRAKKRTRRMWVGTKSQGEKKGRGGLGRPRKPKIQAKQDGPTRWGEEREKEGKGVPRVRTISEEKGEGKDFQ